MIKAVQARNSAEGLRIYRELPPEVQQEKTLLIIRLQASQSAGDDDEYQKTLSDFRGFHPTDACIDFLSIDYFLLRKDYDAALQAIAAVNKSVGGDPYLDVLRGNTLLMAEKYDDADAAFLVAIDAEPELQDAWWGRVSTALKKQDQENVLTLLKEMDGRFKMEWNDLTENEEFAGFVVSPYHQQWLNYRSQPKKSAEE